MRLPLMALPVSQAWPTPYSGTYTIVLSDTTFGSTATTPRRISKPQRTLPYQATERETPAVLAEYEVANMRILRQ